MLLRALAGPQAAVRKAVPQLQLMLGWMKDFPEPRMVAGEELRTIGGSHLEH